MSIRCSVIVSKKKNLGQNTCSKMVLSSVLNDKLLAKYVEWTANRRLKSIGLKAIFDTPISNNPLPWTAALVVL